MRVYFRCIQPLSFYFGQVVEARVVGESKHCYIAEFKDFTYVDFTNSANDRSFTNRQRVWKWRCTVASETGDVA